MKILPLLGLLAGLATSFTPAHAQSSQLDDKPRFIADLMGRMTLEEKIGQLRLITISTEMTRERLAEEIAAGRVGGMFNTVTRADNRPLQQAAVQRSRLKIPLFFAYDVVHGHRTVFPIGLGLASSWDMGVVHTSARVAAMEASADGLDMTFAPALDISRDPRWGRMSESFGEDPHLVSEIARATVRGFQGKSPSAPDSVMANIKHFALYGAVEGGRDYNIVDMSPLRMFQDYLPPYRAAVEAGAGGVMTALNSINGIPAVANTWLLQDVLRKDWGFKGVTVSDHGAIGELIKHSVARDSREAVRLAIKAGVDMSMHDDFYLKELPGLLAAGDVQMAEVDNAVRDVLGAKYDMGMFHDPFRRIGDAAQDPANVNAESRLHRDAARDVARKSVVLLENRGKTLPLRRSGNIALIGPLADAGIDIMGSWSAAGVAEQSVTVLQGMRRAAAGKAELLYARGSNVTDDRRVVDYLNYLDLDSPEIVQDERAPQAMIDEAVAVARRADVIVAAVGESRGMSHESSSRTSLGLPESQRKLLAALKSTGKPLVIVLMNGRPLTLNWESENADAMLETWFTGTEGGNAIADVLFGDYNPAGKLPVSFPRSIGQIPTYYNHPRIGRPVVEGTPPNYTSQYFEEANGPLYPFGYGLSYTQFAMSPPAISSNTMPRGGSVEVAVRVRNIGDRDGETVVQLYIQDVDASVVRSVKELKDFRKIMLRAGEEQIVRFMVDESRLKFFNAQLQHVAEPGRFNVQIGLDSKAVQQVSFELQ